MKSQPTKAVTASEAKVHFGEILNTCVYGNTPITITKHDKPVAVLVKIEDWKAKNTPDKNSGKEIHPIVKRVQELRKSIREYQRKNPPKQKNSDVEICRMARKELENRGTK